MTFKHLYTTRYIDDPSLPVDKEVTDETIVRLLLAEAFPTPFVYRGETHTWADNPISCLRDMMLAMETRENTYYSPTEAWMHDERYTELEAWLAVIDHDWWGKEEGKLFTIDGLTVHHSPLIPSDRIIVVAVSETGTPLVKYRTPKGVSLVCMQPDAIAMGSI